jgi:hypothetical protein
MKTFAMLDNRSGFVVVYVGHADAPESACVAAAIATGGEATQFEAVPQLASGESGYVVHAAPTGFFAMGQSHVAAAALAALPLVGRYRAVRIPERSVVQGNAKTMFMVRKIVKGERYGASGSVINQHDDPLVEITTLQGKVIARYRRSTIMQCCSGLVMDLGTPEWRLDASGVRQVQRILADD